MGRPKKEKPPAPKFTGTNTDERLRSLRDRAVRLTEERKALASDLKDIYAEAKSAGYDVDALKLVVRDVCEDDAKKQKRATREEMADMMRHSLGMIADLPLGQAAIERAG